MITRFAPDSPKSNLLPRYNSILMGLIQLLVMGLAVLSTAAVAAMPVLLLRDAPPALTGAIAVVFAGFQWHTATITRRGWLEGIAQYWSKYDQANPQRGTSTALCRLPAIYCFPIDYAYALWSHSSPLFLGALFVGFGARYVAAPPLLVAAAVALLPPVCQMVRSAILLTPAAPATTTTLRGQIRAAFDEAMVRQTKIVAHASIPWGGLQLVLDRTFTHLGLVGNNRSGKTVNLRLILQIVLRAIGIDCATAARAIVFDPKTTFIPYISGMGLLEKPRIMNPFDLRSWAWDIAADIDTPTDATNVAANFCPERKGGASEFFEPAARDVLASVILAFHMTCPRKWDLRDVLLAHRTPDRLKMILSRTPQTRHTLDRYGGDPRTLANVTATSRKNLSPFEPIAASWQYVGAQKMSLTAWCSSEAVLVFGYSDTAKEQLNIINRCMFQRLSNLLLSGEGGATRGRTWIIIDECREQGELPGLSSILVRGAEHRVHAVLGFQSVLGMQEVYGEKVAGEILGQSNNLAVFRLGNDRKTAEWAADVIGKAERLERHRSETEGRDRSQTTSESTHDRYLYMPEELQNLPATCPEHGLQGIFVSEQYGVVDAADAQFSGAQLFGEMLLPPDESVPAFIPRPHSQHYLEDWNDDDLLRLGFDGGDGNALGRVRRM